MNTCKRCGKENQDHYKFCLGCGAELVSAAQGGAAMAKTVMADASQLAPQPGFPQPGGMPAPAGVAGPQPRTTPITGAPLGPSKGMAMPSPLSVAGGPPPVVAPAAFVPDPYGRMPGSPGPSPSAMQPAMAPQMAQPTAPPVAAAPESRRCPACGFEVPPNFMFCGACGNRMSQAAPAPAPAAPPPVVVEEPRPHGVLTLIRPDGSEGGTHDLVEGENLVGRAHGQLFASDGYLSPRHAEIVINGAGAVVRDLDSLNGVYVRIAGEEEIQPGDVFRIGQELIRFDLIAAPAPLDDGTEVMGSPNPGYWGRLSVIIGKDLDGSAFPLLGESVTIGRERGDINFPDDGYVSGLHARMSGRSGKYFLTDLGSSNGTFLKLRAERLIENGNFFLLGQQLFRLNLT